MVGTVRAVGPVKNSVTLLTPDGVLFGTLWNPEAAGSPVLGIHGITANHVSFESIADRHDGPVAAFDLRGRGQSRNVSGPYGLRQQAADMAAAIESLGWSAARVVGHSMGAFVAVLLASTRPELVRDLTLIDGGVPVETEPDADPAALLGPAVERLSMQFPSRAAYRGFWREHPAFGPYWNSYIEDYVDYDLVEVDGGLQPTAVPDAVLTNVVELDGRDGYAAALESLTTPTTLFVSPRGLQDETPGLYSSEWLDGWRNRLPGVRVIDVPDTNHYTILLSAAASAISDHLKESA